MPLAYTGNLYILAFDHRGTFERTVGRDRELIPTIKQLIWDGFLVAVERGVSSEAAAVLVDAKYGATVAREARSRGIMLAMPVEKSGQDEFAFEYGDAFHAQLDEYDATFAKALVRLNPRGDSEMNERQISRLRILSDRLRASERHLLLELLVPPTPGQLESAGGDVARWDVDERPQLMIEAIHALQDGGVEPDLWKVEGIEDPGICAEIVDHVRRGGRDDVACVVLGRGESRERVEAWLRAAAVVDGYSGFAVGRSIFVETVHALVADPENFDHAAGASAIADAYHRLVEVYDGAASGRP
jgi:myo-inositol catabolism protein IolC